MLLRKVILLANIPLEGREDALLLQQLHPTRFLQVDQRLARLSCLCVRGSLRVIAFWRDGEVLEFFSKDDDGLLGEQWVLRRRKVGRRVIGCGVNEVLLCLVESREVARSVEGVLSLTEEREDEGETLRIELVVIRNQKCKSQSCHSSPET